MAIRIELPKELINKALRAAIATNNRNKNSSTNEIIRGALEQENNAIGAALNGLTEIK